MKKYTFEIGPIHERKIALVFTKGGCQEAEDKLLPSSNARLLTITKRRPMNGIVWR